ncbi:MAG: serine/threonine-protein kinase [Phycisphaerales bacterium]
MTSRQDREQEIFANAMELPETERSAFLDNACGEDTDLRKQLDSLIQAMNQAGEQGFFDRPTGGATKPMGDGDQIESASEEEQSGAYIGNYKILNRIGEGGFGSVYRAEQTSPMTREVALKIIKLGMDTRQVIARFEAERQALALMDHPAIATVYDAGATKSGRLYFVMELVRGLPITKYCDQHNLSIRDRLMLFQEVCGAVQHAHQKSVIHRDIKPSNVLVAHQDNQPVPKVIDFGIAKATDIRLSAQTIYTEYRQLVGTPAYMSPEQAGNSQGDIDTRSDVYSLGVLLYELLTGATPIDSETLTRSGYDEIQRIIREVTPPKPSTRLSSADTTVGISKHRHTDPKKLQQEIQGDLDWIVMKALEKDRSRRYETVNALADDIGRYLRNEPVIARPPSGAYRFSKFVQRNKGPVAAGVTLLCVLLLGVAGTTWGLVWALDEREKARIAAQDELAAQIAASEAAEKASSEAERATREAQTAEELSRFFVMDVLSAADPARNTNKELTVREALINASKSIEGRFEGRPDFESKLHNALGYLFSRLGTIDRAEFHHRREWAITQEEYGELSFENARIMHSVVADLAMLERFDEAINLTKHQLEIIDQLDSLEAEQFRLRVIGNLGALLTRTQQFEESVPILEEILDTKRLVYGDRHPTTLSTIDALSTAVGMTGELERALEYAKESYRGQVEVLGEGDPRSLNSLVKLSLTHSQLGQHEEAEVLLRQGIEQADQRLESDHPTSLYLRGTYASSLVNVGDYLGAEEAVLEMMPDIKAADPDLLLQQSRSVLSVLTTCLIKKEEFQPALELANQTLDSARVSYPEHDTRLVEYLTQRAGILKELERFEESQSDLTEAWGCVDHASASNELRVEIARSFVELYQTWYEHQPNSRFQDLAVEWESKS